VQCAVLYNAVLVDTLRNAFVLWNCVLCTVRETLNKDHGNAAVEDIRSFDPSLSGGSQCDRVFAVRLGQTPSPSKRVACLRAQSSGWGVGRRCTGGLSSEPFAPPQASQIFLHAQIRNNSFVSSVYCRIRVLFHLFVVWLFSHLVYE
jgi:hypothetical protein